MKKNNRLLALLLALLMGCFVFLVGCNTADQNVEEGYSSKESSSAEKPLIPYEIFYKERSDGTCYVSDIRIYDTETSLTIEIPSVSPEGRRVVEYRTTALSYQESPRLILAEDFVAHIQAPLKAAYENGDLPYYLYNEALGYFYEISLENVKTQRAKDQMLTDYPLTAVTDLYEFLEDVSPAKQKVIVDCLRKYCGYSGKQYAADIDHMAQVAEANGISQSLPLRPNHTDNIVGISLPNSMTVVCDNAFNGCINALENQDGVFYLGNWAVDFDSTKSEVALREGTVGIATSTFANYDALERVTLPDGLKYLGAGAFEGCNALETIKIPGSVTEIKNQAFANCDALKSVVIDEGVATIAYKAFEYCEALEQVIFPESLINIGGLAFGHCKSLTSVHIPKNLTSIGTNPFEYCSALESITVDPENTGYYSRGNCVIRTKDHSVEIGCKNSVIPNDGSVSSILHDAFSGCEDLTRVVIPDGVTKIGLEAFYGCKNLSVVVIPKSVTRIWGSSFSACTSLSAVYYGGTAEEWEKIDIDFPDTELISATVYYYAETKPISEGNYWRFVDGVPTAW